MKESVTASVHLNIAMVFIVVVFSFIGSTLSYYKAFKVNNMIADTIEKYEGYNASSKNEISLKLSSLGYDQSGVKCGAHTVKTGEKSESMSAMNEQQKAIIYGQGYCVYYNVLNCQKDDTGTVKSGGLTSGPFSKYCAAESYNYVIKTYLRFDIPIIHSMLKFPIYTKTNALYACYGKNC